jgi:large conductance mechanosensitive channel
MASSTDNIKQGASKAKGFVTEFREFISKGNVVDMAVGVIVGAAFGKIVTSLVSDIIMPLIGMITGGSSLKQMYVMLSGPSGFSYAAYPTPDLAMAAGYSTLNYGSFLQTILDFLIIALCIFIVIKAISKAKNHIEKPVEKPVTTKKCPYCCSEIDIAATRCPHCTSVLDDSSKK